MVEVSVIVVTLSSRDEIDCLDAFEHDSFDDYEVIISRREGISAARNDGIRRASTDKLVFLDDDTCPNPGYLSLATDLLDEHPIVAGRVVYPDDDLFANIAANRVYDQGLEPRQTDYLVGCNMLFRRNVFNTVGYFDENIDWGHDETLFARRAKLEFPIFYYPDLVVTHRFGDSVLDWWRKQVRWGPADVYAAKVNQTPVFSDWYEFVPVSSGDSISEALVKTIGKNIRNFSRLIAMVRGVPDPPDTAQPPSD